MARAHVQRAEAQILAAANENAALGGGAACVGIDQSVGHLREFDARSAVTLTLNVGAGALEEEEELIGQSIGLEVSRVGAKLHQPRSVVGLAFLDDDARRVVLLGKLDGGIRHRTAAVNFVAKLISRRFDKGPQLRIGIAGVRPHHLLVTRESRGSHAAQIFSDQQILRLEVTVERHLVGLSRGRDLVDAHAANSPGIEEVTGRIEDAFARGDLRLDARMSCGLQKTSLPPIDTLLTGK